MADERASVTITLTDEISAPLERIQEQFDRLSETMGEIGDQSRGGFDELKRQAYDPKDVFSHFIFFYGRCSIPKPFAITGAEMDQHFSWAVYEPVDEVNKYFQNRLFSILAGAQ